MACLTRLHCRWMRGVTKKNEQSWENEEASWEFEPREEFELKEQNSFEDDLPVEFPQEQELLKETSET